MALTAVWSFFLLRRSPTWHPDLRTVVLVAGCAAALGVVVARPLVRSRRAILMSGMAAGVALAAGLAGPAAYALETAGTPHSGSIPSAGPAVSGGNGFGFGRFGGGPRAGFPGGGFGGPPGAAPGGGVAGGPGGSFSRFGRGPRGGFPGGGLGGGGGLLNATTPDAAITEALQSDAPDYRWVAAAIGSNSASGYQLATGDPVMAIGGFNGTDPAPALAAFERYVSEGDIHYFIAGGGFGAGQGLTGTDDAGQIASWVESHYAAETIGGVTVYNLSASGHSASST